MRELTTQELANRDRRREGLLSFLREIPPALSEFVRTIVVDNPERYIQEPEQFLPVLDKWLMNEDLSKRTPSERLWLQTRIAYAIAAALQKRFDSVWIVDEDPNSKFFLRYVLGYFKGGLKPGLVLDPISIALDYVDTPPPRSLIGLLDSIDELKPQR